MTSPVCVTGLGAVSPLGLGCEALWSGMLEGKTIVKEVPPEWYEFADYSSGIWSPLPDLDFRELGFSRTEVLQRDRVSLLAMLAAQEAIQQAGLVLQLVDKRHDQYALQGVDSTRAGVFLGTGIGGATTFLQNHAHQVLSRAVANLQNQAAPEVDGILSRLEYPQRANRMAVPMLMPNAVSASIGIRYGLHGCNRTATNACAAGTSAIGDAWKAVAAGELDLAICGGAEYLYDPYGTIYRGFDMLGTLAKPVDTIDTANRPFDKARTGFLYAQGGAGVMVLESAAHAQARGATALAIVKGFAETFDAKSMVALAEDGEQIEAAIRHALQKAGVTPKRVGYINAHGTGTQANDAVESAVIDRLFPHKPKVASSKSLLGHAIGASGALEALITVKSLRERRTPASANLDHPEFPLSFVTDPAAPLKADLGISCSYAFGGHNAVLVFGLS